VAGVAVLMATPGRLNDVLEMGKVDLAKSDYWVLDEADRMLDMGFEPQIRQILQYLPTAEDGRQTLFFTATWPREVQKLASELLKKDVVHMALGDQGVLNANAAIDQRIEVIDESDKPDRLRHLLRDVVGVKTSDHSPDAVNEDHPKTIIFCSKKHNVNRLTDQLWNAGFACDALHGDREQWERTKIMNKFKDGTLKLLIATDVASRGLDVKDVSFVINYDFPVNGVEDYVHRIGRTGRAGATGIAVTLFTKEDAKFAGELCQVLRGAKQPVPEALSKLVIVKSGGFRRRWGGGGGGGRGGGFGRGRGRGGGGRGRSFGGR
jgi:ATP-dependent RNA helicase DDX5/DBP2